MKRTLGKRFEEMVAAAGAPPSTQLAVGALQVSRGRKRPAKQTSANASPRRPGRPKRD
ncbi:MAG: hypothetical protein M3Y87_08205 [Myxococcota bacterium]|nr:hypothetical protein [Myxococcota bacterium]